MVGKVEVIQSQGAGVAEGTGSQEEFHGFTLFGQQDMDAQAVEIAFFAGNVASPLFPSIKSERWMR